MVCITVLSEGYYMPIFNEAVSLFASFELAPEIASAIIRPFGKGFAVTPKGNDSLSGGVMPYRKTLLPTSILLTLNILIFLRILFAIGDSVAEGSSGLLAYGFIWCLFNITLLVISVLLSLQKAQPRLEHRMLINREAQLISSDGSIHAATVIDLSLTGGLVHASCDHAGQEKTIQTLKLDCNLEIPVERQWIRKENLIALQFRELEVKTKKKLVGYAFSGEFRSAEQPQKIELAKTLQQIIAQATRSTQS